MGAHAKAVNMGWLTALAALTAVAMGVVLMVQADNGSASPTPTASPSASMPLMTVPFSPTSSSSASAPKTVRPAPFPEVPAALHSTLDELWEQTCPEESPASLCAPPA